MNPIIKVIGIWWLSGPKYGFSRQLAGKAWHTPISEVLALVGRDLKACTTLEAVVGCFKGLHWVKDPLFQAWDRVYPPMLLVKRGGDDCDGWAMAHALAVQEALGWPSRIVSYLADPWQWSHHFAVVQAPDGTWWTIQPQAAVGAPYRLPIYGPFASIAAATEGIAGAYGVRLAWYDVRHPDWTLDYTVTAPASAGVSS